MMRRLRVLVGFWTFAAPAAGWLWLGVPGVVGGLAGAVLWRAAGIRRNRRQRAARVDEALPDALDEVAAALRAGANLPIAIADARVPPALRPAFAAARDRLRVGQSIEEALDAFALEAATPHARVVANALRLGHRAGGNLPRVLDVLAEAGRDHAALIRETRAATAQTRLSAWVVALMPVAFLALMGAASREQIRVLTSTPAGWVCLAAGGTLEAAGVVWMRRLAIR